jgi:hypothetical protein
MTDAWIPQTWLDMVRGNVIGTIERHELSMSAAGSPSALGQSPKASRWSSAQAANVRGGRPSACATSSVSRA